MMEPSALLAMGTPDMLGRYMVTVVDDSLVAAEAGATSRAVRIIISIVSNILRMLQVEFG